MSVNMEYIDQLRARANVSYEEAKEALEKCNNDIVEALIYLEKQNKVKKSGFDSIGSEFMSSMKKLIKEGNETKVIISKEKNVVLNVPVNVAVVTAVIAAPVVLGAAAVAVMTDHAIKIEKPEETKKDQTEETKQEL